MRRIGTLADGSLARRFCDYLVTLSIDATTDSDTEVGDNESGTVWNIWIRDETDVDKARLELSAFEKSPHSDRYQVDEEVSRIRDDRIAEQQRRLQQQREMVRSMPAGRSAGSLSGANVRQQSIPITIGVIAIAVVASFSSNFGSPRGSRVPGKTTIEQNVYFGLSFVDRRDYAVSKGDPFASIRKGEAWRFVTPMFLHGDTFHLAFNMLMFFFFGSVIERLHGSWFLLLLTMGTQIAGMMLQVMLPDADYMPEALRGSPFAIGASGAVYGLFGYLWIRPTVDPGYPIHMVPMNVAVMLGWLVACMTPLFPNVANGAHLGGLFAGILAAVIVHVFQK